MFYVSSYSTSKCIPVWHEYTSLALLRVYRISLWKSDMADASTLGLRKPIREINIRYRLLVCAKVCFMYRCIPHPKCIPVWHEYTFLSLLRVQNRFMKQRHGVCIYYRRKWKHIWHIKIMRPLFVHAKVHYMYRRIPHPKCISHS